MESIARFSTNWVTGFLMIMMIFISCDKGNQPPEAKLTIYPPLGDSLTLFEFLAGESTDDLNYQKGLVCRWDFNGDGQWDTQYHISKTSTHRFLDPGIYAAAVEVRDLDGLTSVARDTVEVMGMNRDIDTLTDPRDGSRYLIVKVLDRWWMAENLHFGTEIPTNQIQTNNGIVEMYRNTSLHAIDTSGGVYHWLEAMNYQVNDQQGICPDGWHIASREDWNVIFNHFPFMYAHHYFGKNGISRLNLDLGNGANRWTDGSFWWAMEGGPSAHFWTPSYEVLNNDYHPYYADFNAEVDGARVALWINEINILEGDENVMYFPVRCIKD